jgi:flavin-dependent dehydrogenase
LAIHWSIPILEKILPPNLANRLFEAQCDPGLRTGPDHTIQFRNSETGDVLKTISTPNMKRVSRKKLRALCAEGIEVQWGKALNEVVYTKDGQRVSAHFSDGSIYQGDILVGADGPKSKVREILLGVEKARSTPLEIVYNMSIVKYGDAEKSLHVRSGHPQNLFGYCPKGIFSFIAGIYLTSVRRIRDKILIMIQSKTCPIQTNPRLGHFRLDLLGWVNEMPA